MEEHLNEGDMLECSGPVGKVNYYGWGKFSYKKNHFEHKKTKVALFAGGTGITPMYSIALASSLAKDGLKIWFMFSNKTKDDILCKEEMEALAASNPENLKVFHTLTRHNPAAHGDWNGKTGRVSWDMYKECGMPAVADDVLVLTCGPSGFKDTIRNFCQDNGFVMNKHIVW